MTRPLRAIIVEDSENDAQLMVRALRKGGFDVDFRLVDTPDSMRAALREGKWDIVLSDHSMPHFSAPEALNILKEGGVTLPFIIISGSIGAELAVSLMRTGAHDWIDKDDISRLVPAVERELEEALTLQKQKAIIAVSEEKFRTLASSTTDWIYWIDPKGNCVFTSPSSLRISGYGPEEFLSDPDLLIHMTHPDDKGRFEKHLTECTSPSIMAEPCEIEFRILKKDGDVRWISHTCSPIVDKNNQYLGRRASNRDTTNRKRAEELLRESEKRYRLLVDSAFEAIIVAQDGMLRLVNPMAITMTGFSEQELMSKPFPALVHPDDRAMVVDTYQRRLRGEAVPARYAFRLLAKDGIIKWMEVSAVAIDWEGRPATLSFLTDITERRLAEEALQLKNLVFEASIAANSIADLSGKITETNDAFLRVWGYPSKDEAIGKPLPHFFNEPNEAVAIVTALNDSGEWEGDFTAKRKDGSTFIAHGLATTVKNENGNVIGYQSAVIDITERKRAEHDANERMKELRGFYYLAEIVAREGIALEEVYREFVGVLPESWQYPEITCARIVIGGEQFRTENYGESVWKQSASIKVNAVARGTIEICYLEERPEEDEGPFLKEERQLIEGIAERLGRIIEQRVAEETLVKRTGEAEDAKVKANAYFDFLAHDISNLLTPVMAYAGMISFDAETPGPSKRKADRIVGQMRRATSFILSLRRLQDVELLTQERMESRDLGMILDQAVTRVKAEYEDKHISATVVHAAEQVGFMGGKHLEDIIVGVLENSVEAAERDDLALEVKATLVRENDHKLLMLELMDDGPGIKDDLKMCFSVSEDPRKRFAVGTHRGVASSLVIASAIVSQLGGRLWIEDRIPGDCSKGSRIVIKFPEEGFFGT